jgi:hypothetical protein
VAGTLVAFWIRDSLQELTAKSTPLEQQKCVRHLRTSKTKDNSKRNSQRGPHSEIRMMEAAMMQTPKQPTPACRNLFLRTGAV